MLVRAIRKTNMLTSRCMATSFGTGLRRVSTLNNHGDVILQLQKLRVSLQYDKDASANVSKATCGPANLLGFDVFQLQIKQHGSDDVLRQIQTVSRAPLQDSIINTLGPLLYEVASEKANAELQVTQDSQQAPVDGKGYRGCRLRAWGDPLTEVQLAGKSKPPAKLLEHVGGDTGELKIAHLMGAQWSLDVLVADGAQPDGQLAVEVPIGERDTVVEYAGKSASDTLRRSYAYAAGGAAFLLLVLVGTGKLVAAMLAPSPRAHGMNDGVRESQGGVKGVATTNEGARTHTKPSATRHGSTQGRQ